MQHNLAAGATKYELLAFKYFAVPRVRLLQVQHIVHSNAIAMEALKLDRRIVQLVRRAFAAGHLGFEGLGLLDSWLHSWHVLRIFRASVVMDHG